MSSDRLAKYAPARKYGDDEETLSQLDSSRNPQKEYSFSSGDVLKKENDGCCLGLSDMTFLSIMFALISFSYMLPWTALGSLISYYNKLHGASFYVKLYCAYYLPGLPVAYFQRQTDSAINRMFGTKNAYLCRGLISFGLLITILILLIFTQSQLSIVLLFMLLGITSWHSHGSASSLAAMFPPSTAILGLQTGFSCPQLYALTAVQLLHIDANATYKHLIAFYALTATVVTVFGLVPWFLVTNSSVSSSYFQEKDAQLRMLSPGLSDELIRDEEDFSVDTITPSAVGSPSTSSVVSGLKLSLFQPRARAETLGPPLNKQYRELSFLESRPRAKSSIGPRLLLGGANDAGFMEEGLWTKLTRSMSTMHVMIQRQKSSDLTATETVELTLLCQAVFITIWCSIFQGPFYAYVKSASSSNGDIAKTLYFVRLFSDLFGRVITNKAILPRPKFLETSQQLLYAATARIGLLVMFFAYLLVPAIPRSDMFVILLVAVFSLQSGYFMVLINEYAARGLDKVSQTYAAREINLWFQMACFISVLMGVTVTSLGLLDHRTN